MADKGKNARLALPAHVGFASRLVSDLFETRKMNTVGIHVDPCIQEDAKNIFCCNVCRGKEGSSEEGIKKKSKA